MLPWRLPAVAPWLVVSFDDITGILVISKAGLHLSITSSTVKPKIENDNVRQIGKKKKKERL